jgi:hypothetical protein
MAGLPAYSHTRILAVEPGDLTVPVGEPLTISVQFAGRLPEDARIEWLPRGGRLEPRPLSPAAGTAFELHVPAILEPARYRVVAGDCRSRQYRIAVRTPPGLRAWQARIAPSAYTRLDAFEVNSEPDTATPGIPVHSRVTLTGASTSALDAVQVLAGATVLGEAAPAGTEEFSIGFVTETPATLQVGLRDVHGLSHTQALPLEVLPDRVPVVTVTDGQRRFLVEPGQNLPLPARVTDDFGLARIGLAIQSDTVGDERDLAVWPTDGTTLERTLVVEAAALRLSVGDVAHLRVWAEDDRGDHPGGRGYSQILTLQVAHSEDAEEEHRERTAADRQLLTELIGLQRDNLHDTRRMAESALGGNPVPVGQLEAVIAVQTRIRSLAVGLVGARDRIGDPALAIAGLVNHEMNEAVSALRDAQRPGHAGLTRAVRLETTILAVLSGAHGRLDAEALHRDRTDLLAVLERLVRDQGELLAASKRGPALERDTEPASRQDRLATDFMGFCDRCLLTLQQQAHDEFLDVLRTVYDLFQEDRVYEEMLTAAEALELGDTPRAVQSQTQARRSLVRGLDIFNQWRVRNARDTLVRVDDALDNAMLKLTDMERTQARITEITRQLADHGRLTDEDRDLLGAMDREQEPMADLVEELAQDLYQFPELPVCHELNTRMREIFVEVEQALDSRNTPAIEVAVQKEDALLDAIRSTLERIDDLEMWLPDVPDHIAWNMESFDADEFPDIPLVPLPDELEDMVGELLDQAEAITELAQDTTGNNLFADAEMGWAVMDGPMPNFSAKGKSGNTRPNDNEMTGRSGAGREGQAAGELVEARAKGLEGRETHARRTRDPFQQGTVTEDEDSTLDARATGGGKVGGVSETIGMFGPSPRRDLGMPLHGPGTTPLRQEAEALYAKARLLYLTAEPAGTLAHALQDWESPPRLESLASVRTRVLRALEDAHTELNHGVTIPMPVTSLAGTDGRTVQDVDIHSIHQDYRGLVSEYFRTLGAGRSP